MQKTTSLLTSSARHPESRWLWWSIAYLLVPCLVLVFSSCYAQSLDVHLIYNKIDKAHLIYISTLKETLQTNQQTLQFSESSIDRLPAYKQLPDADLYVSAGVDAANYLFRAERKIPVLFGLIPLKSVPDIESLKRMTCYPRCYFQVLDQPIERQVRLVTKALPNKERVGILYGEQFEPLIKDYLFAITKAGLGVRATRHSPQQSLLNNLSNLLGQSDVLLALPDPAVFNRQTARSILLTSFRRRVPIMGYSAAYTRAGALFSLHTSPEQFAKHSANIIFNVIEGRKPEKQIVFPKHFSVTINQTIANSMGISLDSATNLTDWLKANDEVNTNH